MPAYERPVLFSITSKLVNFAETMLIQDAGRTDLANRQPAIKPLTLNPSVVYMKRLTLLAILAISCLISYAEQISSVETSGSWVYIYNSEGKKFKTLSSSTVGVVKGFSSNFFVSENGSWIYVWNSEARKITTLSKSNVGEVIGVAGDTFTSRNGSWIYTWSKEGKKINTRYAN